jgi:hypothetical protein
MSTTGNRRGAVRVQRSPLNQEGSYLITQMPPTKKDLDSDSVDVL